MSLPIAAEQSKEAHMQLRSEQKLSEKELKNLATRIRMDIIESVHAAKSGHPGGSLSIAEWVTYLY